MIRFVIYLIFHGNLREWTTEKSSQGGTSRGGDYFNNGYGAAYRTAEDCTVARTVGFRPGIWIIN